MSTCVPSCHPGQHITFLCQIISLLGQFLEFSLFLKISTDSVKNCDLVFSRIALRFFWCFTHEVWWRKTAKIKCHSHSLISRICIIGMIIAVMIASNWKHKAPPHHTQPCILLWQLPWGNPAWNDPVLISHQSQKSQCLCKIPTLKYYQLVQICSRLVWTNKICPWANVSRQSPACTFFCKYMGIIKVL